VRTDFLGAAYASRSLPLACQTLVNLIFEPAPPGSAYEGMFYGTPGLKLWATLGTGPIRGMDKAGGYLWVVTGTALYRVSPSGAVTTVTNIPGTGRCHVIHNDTQLIVMHAVGWTVVTLSTLAVATPANAPLTAQGTYQDAYAVFPNANGTYGWSAIGNAGSIDPLDFASAEAQPDPIIAVLSDHRELWLFGDETTEIAQTSGSADLVFTRTAMMEHGCAAKYSPAKADNTVFWVGRDANGQGVVFRADGYTPSRISTFALESAMAGYTISEAWGYCYQQGGHTFYVLTFPEATWFFDVATNRWTQWAYKEPVSGDLKRHRGNAYAFFAGLHLVGDWENGRIYQLDLDTFTDNGVRILRERTWAVIEAGGPLIRHDRLELMGEAGVGIPGRVPGTVTLRDENDQPVLDELGYPLLDESDVDIADPGADPVVRLDWTDDGSRTWSNPRELRIGRLGEFRRRAITRRLGRSRSRVYRLRTDEPVRIAWYGVTLDANVGNR